MRFHFTSMAAVRMQLRAILGSEVPAGPVEHLNADVVSARGLMHANPIDHWITD